MTIVLASIMSWQEYTQMWVPEILMVAVYLLLAWRDKLPTTKSISEFMGILNSRGGNIFILSIASLYFFRYSMYMFNLLLGMVRDKTITEDNAFALMAIQFVTTTAFGGSIGALLKTMTGESPITPDSPPSPVPLPVPTPNVTKPEGV